MEGARGINDFVRIISATAERRSFLDGFSGQIHADSKVVSCAGSLTAFGGAPSRREPYMYGEVVEFNWFEE